MHSDDDCVYEDCSAECNAEEREFYSEEEVEGLLEEDDVISAAEQGFMAGYIRAARTTSYL